MISKKYNIFWHVAHNTHFIDPKSGCYYKGVESIINNADKLPDELQLISSGEEGDKSSMHFLMT